MNPPERLCDSCGRRFAYRRKWARCWQNVRYCSDRCRKAKVGPQGLKIEQTIARLLADLDRSSSICPSQAARALDADWRPLMEPVRAAARRMAARGELVITQKGRVVDPSSVRGPIRLRRT